jgi:iron complex transport system permease protein
MSVSTQQQVRTAAELRARSRRSPRLSSPVSLGIGVALLLAAAYASLVMGTAGATPVKAAQALFAFDPSSDTHVIVRTARLPRMVIGIGVGAALAIAGAIMQALTRNPLADPSILGINYGAALTAVAAVVVFEVGVEGAVPAALAGAAAAAVVVYLLGSAGGGGLTAMKLTVAGAAIAALLFAVMQGVLVLSEQSLEQGRRWLAGSLSGQDLDTFLVIAPYLGAGLIIALALGRALTTFELGEETARGLGQRTALVKGAGGLAVVLLAGSAVAIAGPIGFVGLAVPHLSRAVVGSDYRRVLPHAALHGAVLLLLADVAARLVIPPRELPVGVMTALVGAPFFLHIASRMGSGR